MILSSLYSEITHKMNKTEETLKQELQTVRTGVVSTGLVNQLQVESYGSMMPLNQIATISAPEARTIVIQPWDPTVTATIEKAILKSDLGLMPNSDGKVIRINVPPLSEERRQDLTKVVKKIAEDAKIAIRNIRRDANDKTKKALKAKEITEDDDKKALIHIQELTDKHIENIIKIQTEKEKDILTV
jgi:ribosome recycling factor